MLTDLFGVNGAWLKNSANGIHHSPVVAEREANKSIGHTTTLPADVSEMGEFTGCFLTSVIR